MTSPVRYCSSVGIHMGFSEYGDYDGMGLAELVRKKQVSARELLDEAIARTGRIDPQINAVVVKHYDYAERQIDNGLPDGPFAGVPSTRTMLPTIPAPSPGASSMPGSRSSEKAPVRNSG